MRRQTSSTLPTKRTPSTQHTYRQARMFPFTAVLQRFPTTLGVHRITDLSVITVVSLAMLSGSVAGASLTQALLMAPTATPPQNHHRRCRSMQLRTLLRRAAAPSTHADRLPRADVRLHQCFGVHHLPKRKTDHRSSGGKNCATVELHKASFSTE